MALDVTNMGEYVKSDSSLITMAIGESKLFKIAGKELGVKGKKALNSLSTDFDLELAGCGWNPSGTTTLATKYIEVVDFKIEETICLKDLIGKYGEMQLKDGSIQDTLTFEKAYMEDKLKKVAKKIEKVYFKGNVSTGTGDLAKFDGLDVILTGEAVDGMSAGPTASVAPSNVIDIVNAQVSLIPEAIVNQELVMLVSPNTFRLYVAAMIASNSYHFGNVSGVTGEVYLPGYNIKLMSMDGLVGSNSFYTTYADNIRCGADMESDSEYCDVWFDKKDNAILSRIEFKTGIQVQYPELVVFRA